MDLIRAGIKALVYSFPIELLAEHVAFPEREYLIFPEILTEILKWEEKAFTKSEVGLLVRAIDEEWSVTKEFGINSGLPLIRRFPVLLREFGKDVLRYRGTDDPKVNFSDLLRWRDLSLYVGEDTLILPWLAYEEARRVTGRTQFLWPNILEHDNFRINAILDEELSDTHCHINAATDIFEFNWLRLMTELDKAVPKASRKNNASLSWHNGARKDYNPIERYSSVNLPLSEWGFVAAAIRAYLFRKINGTKGLLDREDILKLYREGTFRYDLMDKVSAEVGIVMSDALPTENGVKLDYAIVKSEFKSNIPTSPLLVHHGERSLLYRWFRGYFLDKDGFRQDTDLMLLYLVIKSKLRREFVQTNPLRGFENFQEYDHVKDGFRGRIVNQKGEEKGSLYQEILYRYAVQTSVGSEGRINLEARMTPGSINRFRQMDFHKSIFAGNQPYLAEGVQANVTFITHFIKGKDDNDSSERRHSSVRSNLERQTKNLKEIIDHQEELEGPNLVGIDAAGSELNCRPEVFAPYFRYLRFHNLRNFTFHAGEDFFDLIDGLRTVEETISFMDYKTGDRIGHGLALGLDPRSFYESRHFNMIAPKQILLDNLVWLKYIAAEHDLRLNPKTLLLVDGEFSRLSDDLGYTSVTSGMTDIHRYYSAMRMRGDLYNPSGDSELAEKEANFIFPSEVLFSPVSPDRDRVRKISRILWEHYESSAECRKDGNKVMVLKVHESFAEDVALVQSALLKDLEKRCIVIETNPSSNLKIGRFSRYDEHPVLHFHDISSEDKSGTSMIASINTDDKGIFSTSLKNEYSLIAAALFKKRGADGRKLFSDLQIENYIRRIAHYGNISRFR